MILSDDDLRERLAEIDFETSNPNFTFDPDRQVQPCSIDLRLGDVAWKPRRFRRIDLSNNTPLGPQVTSAFERISLAYPKGFLLRPKQFILCRTYEKFSIPSDLMGRLVGRSSFGRLGLSVVGPSNFINPGWRGHMPLMIVNESPFAIRLHPYLGIVQLCLFGLTKVPAKVYGQDGVGSKYLDDDGGPSKHWLDHTIETLRKNNNAVAASPEARQFLEAYSGELDEPTRRRFARTVDQWGVITNVDDLIAKFVADERRRLATIILVPIVVGIAVAILTSGFSAMWAGGIISKLAIVLLALFALGLLAWIFRAQFGTTIQPGELARIATALKGKR